MIQLENVSIRGAEEFFIANKNKRLSVELYYKDSYSTTIGWTDKPENVIGYTGETEVNYLTVYFSDASLELSGDDFNFYKDEANTTLIIEPEMDKPNFNIRVNV